MGCGTEDMYNSSFVFVHGKDISERIPVQSVLPTFGIKPQSRETGPIGRKKLVRTTEMVGKNVLLPMMYHSD